MKKLRWRLFLHFSLQFISVAALMVIVIFLTLFIVIGIYAKDVSSFNYYQAKLEMISVNTGASFTKFKMNEDWDREFEKEKIWVQILDHEGNVIESGNVPDELPKKYTYQTLENMKETKQLQDYSLAFYLETFYETPYLFILGYHDEEFLFLKQLVEDFGTSGTIVEKDLPKVEALLTNQNGALKVYGSDKVVRQTIGRANNLEEKALDVFVRDAAPDIFSTKKTTYVDTDNGFVWELYTPDENKEVLKLDAYIDLAKGFIITGAIILFITIVISIWNGFRYGNPLFVFANWLGRMGNENYSEVLTERERKKIYRKNGKIRLKFKLYQEVFEAFHDMAGKLDASRKEREQLEKTRTEWMTGISHDLRTPLTTMQGYGNLLESGQYDWTIEEIEEIGKTIREKSDYMLHLIEDFSLSFQLKHGGNQIQMETVEINQLLDGMVEKYKRDITFKDYILSFVPIQSHHFLYVNKRLFERLLDNLIYNALKHNPPGTKISVILVEDYKRKEIQIVVKDNGVGMDESTIEHLFDRYYRGTNTEEHVEGTGLGMSIAMQIAKLHGGEMAVASTKNIGTEITVNLPAKGAEVKSISV